MLNILIVEDNYEDMEYCAALLLTIRKDINLFKAGTGQKTLEVLEKSNMDVVFLDVRLPDFSGFTLASKIGEMKGRRLTKIIFITAEQHNQLEVYRKFHCYDYISKPFSPETFVSIVNPLLEGIEDQKASTPEPRVDVIILENRYDRYIVEKKDVLFVESMGRVINVYCRAQVIEGIRYRLEDFIKYMNDPYFLRCHKSFAVNLFNAGAVVMRTNRSWDVTFHDWVGRECRIGRTYYRTITEKLEEMGMNKNE